MIRPARGSAAVASAREAGSCVGLAAYAVQNPLATTASATRNVPSLRAIIPASLTTRVPADEGDQPVLDAGASGELDARAVLAAAPHRLLVLLHPGQHPGAALGVEVLVLPRRPRQVPRVQEDV